MKTDNKRLSEDKDQPNKKQQLWKKNAEQSGNYTPMEPLGNLNVVIAVFT